MLSDQGTVIAGVTLIYPSVPSIIVNCRCANLFISDWKNAKIYTDSIFIVFPFKNTFSQFQAPGTTLVLHTRKISAASRSKMQPPSGTKKNLAKLLNSEWVTFYSQTGNTILSSPSNFSFHFFKMVCRRPRSTRQSSPAKKVKTDPSWVIGDDSQKFSFHSVTCFYKSPNCIPVEPSPNSEYYIIAQKANSTPKFCCKHHMIQNSHALYRRVILTD